jgi:hypothetical protein
MSYRTLCVLLVVISRVSFRSVPRILGVVLPWFGLPLRRPHFTSVIHWTLRAGLARFQQVAPLNQPWIALLDCSIAIGTRKALVVLRVALSALHHKQGALGLQDCEWIGQEMASHWDGPQVAAALTRIFHKTGTPAALLKDGGTDLRKGVALWCAQQPEPKIYILEDIGQVAANALKALFAPVRAFQQFLSLTARAAARIRQTHLAWLLPPQIRSQGRFQGITKVARWALHLLEFMAQPGSAPAGTDFAKIRKAFAGWARLRPFLNRFAHTCALTEQFLKRMKTRGLNATTAQTAPTILAQFPPRSLVRKRLSQWVEKHLQIHQGLGLGSQPLLVSSDVIESLLGLFKTLIQRPPQAELNRLLYVLPLLCGNHSAAEIDRALQTCSHTARQDHLKQTVPQTLRQYRFQAFKKYAVSVPKSGTRPKPDTG